jgi:UTP--glucose-1-phosphate uridylyltransferase
MEVYEDQRPACVIAVEEVPSESVSAYGIVKPDGKESAFKILDLIEKPSVEEAPSNLAIAARYVLAPGIYQALNQTLPGRQGELQLTDAIRILLEQGESVIGFRLPPEEKRYDIGNFESYFKAFIEFAIHDSELGDSIRDYLKEVCGENR